MVILCGCSSTDGWSMRRIAESLAEALLGRIAGGAQASSG
jgi:hypothetical protein